MSARLPALLLVAACHGGGGHGVPTGGTGTNPGTTDTGSATTDSSGSGTAGIETAETGAGIDTSGPTDTGLRRVGVYDAETVAEAKLVGDDGDTGWNCAYPDPWTMCPGNPGNAGEDVGPAGDVDGDGDDEVLVVAPGAYLDSGAPFLGEVYVVKGPIAGHVDLGTQPAATLAAWGAHLASSAGDYDGDGLDDVVVLASDPYTTDSLWLWSATALSGYVGLDASAVEFGHSQAFAVAAADMDGNGVGDLLVTSDTPPGTSASIFLEHGGTDLGYVDMELQTPVVTGSTFYELLGYRVAAGDLDGDGVPELAATSSLDLLGYSSPGDVLLFRGPLAGTLTRDDAECDLVLDQDGVFGTTSVVVPGDMDGDGLDDLALGSPYYIDAATGYEKGVVFLAYNPLATCSGQQSVAGLPDRLIARDPWGADLTLGHALGDFDADGFADVVTTEYAYPVYQATVVQYGPLHGVRGSGDPAIDLEFDGIALGSGAGDVDGDGLTDLLLAQPGDSEGGAFAGAAWLILGGFAP